MREPRLAAVLRYFKRAAAHYDTAAVLAREVAARMESRLDYVKRAPSVILDLGCGTAADEALLKRRYPDAPYIGLDASLPMLEANRRKAAGWRRWLQADKPPRRACSLAQVLPLKPDALGMVWSNFLLHHLDDPLPVFREAHRVLEVEGLLMFACLGPDTLKELRAVAPARVHRFIDMHDLGDMLSVAGFAEPVMDMETITLTYADFDQLVADLRHTGGCYAADDRARGVMSKREAQALRAAYEQFRSQGRLPASFEIIYGHAWKPVPRKTADGRAIIQFDPKQRGRQG